MNINLSSIGLLIVTRTNRTFVDDFRRITWIDLSRTTEAEAWLMRKTRERENRTNELFMKGMFTEEMNAWNIEITFTATTFRILTDDRTRTIEREREMTIDNLLRMDFFTNPVSISLIFLIIPSLSCRYCRISDWSFSICFCCAPNFWIK